MSGAQGRRSRLEADGRLIREWTEESNRSLISVEELNDGVYFLRIQREAQGPGASSPRPALRRLRFEVHILGCGAALPLPGRNPTAQVVNVHEKQFLLDCGEGTQIALRKERIRMMRIDHICISPTCTGTTISVCRGWCPRSISWAGPAHSTSTVRRLKEVLDLHQEVGEGRLDFPLHFHPTSSEEPQVLFEDGSVQLESFPVKHRIPTTGFLLREKEREPGVKRDWVRRHDLVPSEILALKRKEDVVRGDGTRIAFAEACHPVPAARSYAFAADTRYWDSLAEFIRGVDLLYHEATFDDGMKARQRKDLPQHGPAGGQDGGTGGCRTPRAWPRVGPV